MSSLPPAPGFTDQDIQRCAVALFKLDMLRRHVDRKWDDQSPAFQDDYRDRAACVLIAYGIAAAVGPRPIRPASSKDVS